MDISTILKTRHTTKHYDPAGKVSDADFTVILESLRLCPSSVNSQPWEFFIAETPEAKEKLMGAIADFNRERVTGADRVVVACVHEELDSKYLKELNDREDADGRYDDAETKAAGGERRAFFVQKQGREIGALEWQARQAYIAQGFVLFTAAALGVSTTPIEGMNPKAMDEILGLREKGLRSLYAVSFGKGAADDSNASRPKSRWPAERIFHKI